MGEEFGAAYYPDYDLGISVVYGIGVYRLCWENNPLVGHVMAHAHLSLEQGTLRRNT